jgi:hypothetical protein
MRVSLTIDQAAYQVICEDERSLSAAARKALDLAEASGSARKIASSRIVAEEIRDWFTQVATGRLYVEGQEWKSAVCRKAEEAIRARLVPRVGIRQVKRGYMAELG